MPFGTGMNGIKIRAFWDEFRRKARSEANNCSGRIFT